MVEGKGGLGVKQSDSVCGIFFADNRINGSTALIRLRTSPDMATSFTSLPRRWDVVDADEVARQCWSSWITSSSHFQRRLTGTVTIHTLR